MTWKTKRLQVAGQFIKNAFVSQVVNLQPLGFSTQFAPITSPAQGLKYEHLIRLFSQHPDQVCPDEARATRY
jgi:hypothetical protein